MRSRKGKKQLWIMANNNETWIDPITLENISTIYEFLLKKSKSNWAENKRAEFSYSQISNGTGINVKQVQFACQKLAYKYDPYLRIHARKFVAKNTDAFRTSEKVELIRIIDEDDDNSEN